MLPSTLSDTFLVLYSLVLIASLSSRLLFFLPCCFWASLASRPAPPTSISTCYLSDSSIVFPSVSLAYPPYHFTDFPVKALLSFLWFYSSIAFNFSSPSCSNRLDPPFSSFSLSPVFFIFIPPPYFLFPFLPPLILSSHIVFNGSRWVLEATSHMGFGKSLAKKARLIAP